MSKSRDTVADDESEQVWMCATFLYEMCICDWLVEILAALESDGWQVTAPGPCVGGPAFHLRRKPELTLVFTQDGYIVFVACWSNVNEFIFGASFVAASWRTHFTSGLILYNGEPGGPVNHRPSFRDAKMLYLSRGRRTSSAGDLSPRACSQSLNNVIVVSMWCGSTAKPLAYCISCQLGGAWFTASECCMLNAA
jgi:hypothetical protein